MSTEPDDKPTRNTEATENSDDSDTLAERVERFEANNPGASPIEVISQLGINPDRCERVEVVLAQ
ncbi:MAG TPA: hypothetical protein VFJ06_14020 [Halococcus sp.]|nr:hypothetical protein [Halococcus sp.]